MALWPLIPRMRISIHALREEGDQKLRRDSSKRMKFLSTPSARRATMRLDTIEDAYIISIHALREEGDSVRAEHLHEVPVFLSTPSARRATSLPFRAYAKI